MKKRGFTLIELLAVIVILAIIALIATPIVMNVIENSKKGAAERSAENYFSAAETAIAAKRLDGPVQDGTYVIQTDGSLCLNDECTEQTQIKVEVNGNIPSSGTIQIQNSIIVRDSSNMIIGEYTVVYNVTTNSPKATTKTCVLANDLNNDGLGYGDKYACNVGNGILKTFYVLEIGGETQLTKGDFSVTHYNGSKTGTTAEDEISLLMTENIGQTKWCKSTSDKACNADGAREFLAQETTAKGWTVEVNLPTYDQIYAINPSSCGLQESWLSDYNTTDGYATSTTWKTDKNYSYSVVRNAATKVCLDIDITAYNRRDISIRPVITIPKSELE